MQIVEKETQFTEIFESIREIVTQEEICKEVGTGNISQHLISTFFVRFQELYDQLKLIVPNKLFEPVKPYFPGQLQTTDRNTQLDTDYRKMDRNISLGRIFC